jgi:uncharacterized membrane protein
MGINLKSNNMVEYLKIYGVAFVVFTAIDLVWLGFIANKVYQKYLGFIMRPSPNWGVAILFYLVYLAGLVFFVIDPALTKHSWKFALASGMFFGFITYATYDLTNLATLKDWPILITVIDLIWGSVLCGLVSVITFFVVNRLGWL